MHWHGVYARVGALLSSITISSYDRRSTLNRIKENEIQITVENVPFHYNSFDHFIEMIAAMKSGRITLQGANGSGKTTLINLIKAEFHDRAFYLPTNSRLAFEKTFDNAYSTGQKVKVHLDELKTILLDSVKCDGNNNDTPKRILLLDEWDANLDAKNKEQISAMLDIFSKHYCVVEIRHRHVSQ